MSTRSGSGAAAQIATVFGVGSWPGAPGTWASLLTVGFAFATRELSHAHYLLVCAALAALALWAADGAGHAFGEHDDSRIVIDEVLGTLCALAWIDRGDPLLLASGFLLFRVFDIVKPWPISWLDRRVRGGLGVLVDDVAAGLLAAAVLALLG